MLEPAHRHECIAESQLRPMQPPVLTRSPSYLSLDTSRLSLIAFQLHDLYARCIAWPAHGGGNQALNFKEGISLASQTQPTPARIDFSITHREGRVWWLSVGFRALREGFTTQENRAFWYWTVTVLNQIRFQIWKLTVARFWIWCFGHGPVSVINVALSYRVSQRLMTPTTWLSRVNR